MQHSHSQFIFYTSNIHTRKVYFLHTHTHAHTFYVLHAKPIHIQFIFYTHNLNAQTVYILLKKAMIAKCSNPNQSKYFFYFALVSPSSVNHFPLEIFSINL
jgi:hypothetical protein